MCDAVRWSASKCGKKPKVRKRSSTGSNWGLKRWSSVRRFNSSTSRRGGADIFCSVFLLEFVLDRLPRWREGSDPVCWGSFLPGRSPTNVPFCTFAKVQVRQLHSTRQSTADSCVCVHMAGAVLQEQYKRVASHLFPVSHLCVADTKGLCLLIREALLTMSFTYEVKYCKFKSSNIKHSKSKTATFFTRLILSHLTNVQTAAQKTRSHNDLLPPYQNELSQNCHRQCMNFWHL